jgi:hypothetical protein
MEVQQERTYMGHRIRRVGGTVIYVWRVYGIGDKSRWPHVDDINCRTLAEAKWYVADFVQKQKELEPLESLLA